MLRYLRIAFSAACGIACVLLVVLWVRSYWQWDNLDWGITKEKGFSIRSQDGKAEVRYIDISDLYLPGARLPEWRLRTYSPGQTDGLSPSIAGFLFTFKSGNAVGSPYWFLVLTFTAIAVAPWILWKRQFSLGALLIAVTLIALGLGILAISN